MLLFSIVFSQLRDGLKGKKTSGTVLISFFYIYLKIFGKVLFWKRFVSSLWPKKETYYMRVRRS